MRSPHPRIDHTQTLTTYVFTPQNTGWLLKDPRICTPSPLPSGQAPLLPPFSLLPNASIHSNGWLGVWLVGGYEGAEEHGGLGRCGGANTLSADTMVLHGRFGTV